MVLPLDHQINLSMPESWVRASILVRANSLAQGASGVQYSTISGLLTLLQEDITPLIPLRGSISASGDLSPLSYIGGVLEGNPSLSVYDGSHKDNQRHIERADRALVAHSIAPLILRPRDALALVNGTSVCTAVAALASHEALLLASLAQLLTAMSVEGLRGTDESFSPFFTHVRPHKGQAESASNILSFLHGSSLVVPNNGSAEASLRQDRYSIRTAAQWIGPCIEDILLAHRQIGIELNSATDNPLVDISSSHHASPILHGGNFQAKSITSAVEKIRQAAQSMGRMLFTQCTELINPATSQGLPPNLVIAEPSESFIFKGTDILIAALLSELGFLANPVGSHVQSAEMGNQALNSLALISARYTLEALDVLAQLAAAHLVAVCQALDIRALEAQFSSRMKKLVGQVFVEEIDPVLAVLQRKASAEREAVKERCWTSLLNRFDTTTSLDSGPRLAGAVRSVQPLLLECLPESGEGVSALKAFTRRLSDQACSLYHAVRKEYILEGSAEPLLGRGSRVLYRYVREELHVPFVGPATLATPQAGSPEAGVTLGDLNGRVRKSMAEGGLYGIVVQCLKDVENEVGKNRKDRARL